MKRYVEELIAKYQDEGVLVDTNLLLLYVVGRADPQVISQFKRTKQFVHDDYMLLTALCSRFSRILTTPNIATEVSNFLGTLRDDWKAKSLLSLTEMFGEWNEEYRSSRGLAATPAFTKFGLTDASILSVAAQRYLVLTDDFPLSQYLGWNRVDVLNFNHLRTWAWH